MAYIHGAYGEITASKAQSVRAGDVVVGYIGTAPVNLIRGYATKNLVNEPIKVSNMAEATNMLGYAPDWDKFTLCEAFAEHFDNTVQNIGPIYVVNVLDPTVHRKSTQVTKSLTFSNFRCEIESDTIILDTLALASMTEGTDYSVEYNFAKGTVMLKLLGSSSITTVNATYYEIDADAVDSSAIIGSKTSEGVYKGLYAFDLLYSKYNAILNILAAPGWSHIPAVYTAMVSKVTKLNGHWDGFALADIPVEDAKSEEATVNSHVATVADAKLIESTVEVWNAAGTTKGALTTDYTLAYSSGTLTITLQSGGSLYSENKVIVKYKATVATIAEAIAWKASKGYTSENSKVFWPEVKDGAGRIFHLSTVCAATMMATDLSHEGVPFESPSNKEIMATAQYFGSTPKNQGFDQETANGLNEKGITTAAFWAGRWVLWGPHTAAYIYGGNMDERSIFDATLRTLMYITNNFQVDHGTQIDQPMTPQDKDSILNFEKAKLDRLKSIGALIGSPVVEFVESENSLSDMMNGDFIWHFNVTNTPVFKSGTARVTYTDEGFAAFFEA